jgi:hypothetical protein
LLTFLFRVISIYSEELAAYLIERRLQYIAVPLKAFRER